MGNCCSNKVGHVAPTTSAATTDRFLRSKGAAASTQIEVQILSSPPHLSLLFLEL
jgi:hypothetical protein